MEPPQVPADAPPDRSFLRRAGRLLLCGLSWCTAAGILAGLIGQIARDRNVLLALMMYVPLAPLGAWAVLYDLIRRGRSLRPRLMLAGAGLVAVVVGVMPLVGRRPPEPVPVSSAVVTLLHWNVLWGGRSAEQAVWDREAERISAHPADIVVLSEAPPDEWTADTLSAWGGWRSVQLSSEKGRRYDYRLLVCSRWPVTTDGAVPVRNGAAMAATLTIRGRQVRLLVVDGMSTILLLRTAFLHDIAAACERAAKAGAPYDVVVGDFNSVGRSVGFDAIRSAAGGYRDASHYSGSWRATWPAPLPVYDIDHVMPRAGIAITASILFSGTALETDHRGQFVRLALPARVDESESK